MRPILALSAAQMLASIIRVRGIGESISAPRPVVTHRVTSDSKRGRQMNSFRVKASRSKYAPHIGAKEQARAADFRMTDIFPSGAKRASPIMVRFIAPPSLY